MRFASPWALLLLPLVGLYWYACRHGTRTLVFSSVDLVPVTVRSVRQRCLGVVGLLECIGLAGIVVALARPQVGIERLHEVCRGVAIQMVVDISSSMDLPADAFGEKKSRLDIAKRVFEAFIAGRDSRSKDRESDLIGMITFARYADTLCPLTLGHDVLLQFVNDLKPEDRPLEDGTAIGDALMLAAARLSQAPASAERDRPEADADYDIKSKVIILLTDGENNCGRHMPLEGAALARKWGIRIHTIGFGDKPETRVVQTPAGTREIAVTGADTQTLARVAQATGGVFRMASDARSLQAVYQEIDAMEKSDIVRVAQMDYGEAFEPWALGALICLGLRELLAATVLRRIP